MNLKQNLLIALFSFGIAQSTFAETDSEKFDRAVQFDKQQNYSAAFPLFKQLAEQGNSDAQFLLGDAYFTGKGVSQSDKQAVYWWQKAAEQGDAKSQYFLGLMYEDGEGVAQSDEQAVYWYTQAAEKGDEKAQYKLGVAYEIGRGVQQDRSKAKHYYGLACNNGHQTDCENYERLNQQGIK